ncbi:hypothetical protein [Ferruginivarius sediminum]|uniref:Uncharacterized protein n=1 Tax=Ferruginivarius sediminum TaxID=2661937 RepID=A0A369T7R9_9PROT|nr:hypothetical protein [Ferruginivarius sediminum]RDD61350.1 hypothetical protein DRB17_13870 [Ferruginivarius sediminum]
MSEPGVYARDPDGRWRLIHSDRGGDYHLHDIREAFAIGTAGQDEDGTPMLSLDQRDLRQLKALADAQSFDHDPDLIALCGDIYRFAQEGRQVRYTFRQVF